MDAFEKSPRNYIETTKHDGAVFYKCTVVTNIDEEDNDVDIELFG